MGRKNARNDKNSFNTYKFDFSAGGLFIGGTVLKWNHDDKKQAPRTAAALNRLDNLGFYVEGKDVKTDICHVKYGVRKNVDGVLTLEMPNDGGSLRTSMGEIRQFKNNCNDGLVVPAKSAR